MTEPEVDESFALTGLIPSLWQGRQRVTGQFIKDRELQGRLRRAAADAPHRHRPPTAVGGPSDLTQDQFLKEVPVAFNLPLTIVFEHDIPRGMYGTNAASAWGTEAVLRGPSRRPFGRPGSAIAGAGHCISGHTPTQNTQFLVSVAPQDCTTLHCLHMLLHARTHASEPSVLQNPSALTAHRSHAWLTPSRRGPSAVPETQRWRSPPPSMTTLDTQRRTRQDVRCLDDGRVRDVLSGTSMSPSGDLVAMFIEPADEDDIAACDADADASAGSSRLHLKIQYFTEAGLRHFLLGARIPPRERNRPDLIDVVPHKHKNGLLQRFVYPGERRNQLVQVVWTPAIFFVEKKTAQTNIHDVALTPFQRAATFEAPEGLASKGSISRSANERLKIAAQAIIRSTEQVHQEPVLAAVFHFKVDSSNRLWFLFSSRVTFMPRTDLRTRCQLGEIARTLSESCNQSRSAGKRSTCVSANISFCSNASSANGDEHQGHDEWRTSAAKPPPPAESCATSVTDTAAADLRRQYDLPLTAGLPTALEHSRGERLTPVFVRPDWVRSGAEYLCAIDAEMVQERRRGRQVMTSYLRGDVGSDLDGHRVPRKVSANTRTQSTSSQRKSRGPRCGSAVSTALSQAHKAHVLHQKVTGASATDRQYRIVHGSGMRSVTEAELLSGELEDELAAFSAEMVRKPSRRGPPVARRTFYVGDVSSIQAAASALETSMALPHQRAVPAGISSALMSALAAADGTGSIHIYDRSLVHGTEDGAPVDCASTIAADDDGESVLHNSGTTSSLATSQRSLVRNVKSSTDEQFNFNSKGTSHLSPPTAGAESPAADGHQEPESHANSAASVKLESEAPAAEHHGATAVAAHVHYHSRRRCYSTSDVEAMMQLLRHAEREQRLSADADDGVGLRRMHSGSPSARPCSKAGDYSPQSLASSHANSTTADSDGEVHQQRRGALDDLAVRRTLEKLSEASMCTRAPNDFPKLTLLMGSDGLRLLILPQSDFLAQHWDEVTMILTQAVHTVESVLVLELLHRREAVSAVHKHESVLYRLLVPTVMERMVKVCGLMHIPARFADSVHRECLQDVMEAVSGVKRSILASISLVLQVMDGLHQHARSFADRDHAVDPVTDDGTSSCMGVARTMVWPPYIFSVPEVRPVMCCSGRGRQASQRSLDATASTMEDVANPIPNAAVRDELNRFLGSALVRHSLVNRAGTVEAAVELRRDVESVMQRESDDGKRCHLAQFVSSCACRDFLTYHFHSMHIQQPMSSALGGPVVFFITDTSRGLSLRTHMSHFLAVTLRQLHDHLVNQALIECGKRWSAGRMP